MTRLAAATLAVALTFGCSAEEQPNSADASTPAWSAPAKSTSATPRPTPAQTPASTSAPILKYLVCARPDFLADIAEGAGALRRSSSTIGDMAVVLDNEPSAILRPDTVDVADAFYSAADGSNAIAVLFPDEQIAEALFQHAALLGTAGNYLQYGSSDADAAEAAEALRAVARIGPPLADALEGYC